MAVPVARHIDPDMLLAAVIEAVAENLPGDDADVIPFRQPDDDKRDAD